MIAMTPLQLQSWKNRESSAARFRNARSPRVDIVIALGLSLSARDTPVKVKKGLQLPAAFVLVAVVVVLVFVFVPAPPFVLPSEGKGEGAIRDEST